MAKRKRDIPLFLMVTEKERAQIEQRMQEASVRNMGAFIRKMAIDGYIIHLDTSDVRKFVTLLRRCSNNVNQIAKWAHETHNLYAEDIEELRVQYNEIWEQANKIIQGLANIQR